MKSFNITCHSLQCCAPKATNSCRSSKWVSFFATHEGVRVDDGVVRLASCQTFWAISYCVGSTLVASIEYSWWSNNDSLNFN
jgi:hypothetical protein